MDKDNIDTYIMLLRHEMLADQVDTFNRDDLKQIILRAGGKSIEVEEALKHPSIGEIEEDLFFLKSNF